MRNGNTAQFGAATTVANGNPTTGTVGGTVEVVACTPMENETAEQLGQLSDWFRAYRARWGACGTNSNPAECRAKLSKGYQGQQKALLDVLAAMNGKPKVERKKILHRMRLTNLTLLAESDKAPKIAGSVNRLKY